MVTKVFNLLTGDELYFTCEPEEAVIAAYAQDKGDLNTWDYKRRYAGLLCRGDLTVAVGHFAAFSNTASAQRAA